MPPLDLELHQAYLAAIVESSDDAIMSKDLDGIVQSFNAAAERLFGYAAAEIIGHPITILLPPERIHEESEILARLQRGERVEHFETVRVTRDGRRLEVSLSVSPLRDATGTIVGAAKIIRDVTERNRAARALAAQQEWFRVTLGSIGDAVIAADSDGRITFVNAVAERLTGWPTAEAAGRPLADVFHIVNEQTRQPVDDPTRRVIRDGVTVGLANHTVLIARDGTEWPIADSAAPILDAQGRILGVVLVFHDVSEQRGAEAALAEQREWLETTLSSIGDAVIATDTHGQVAFMNRVAEQLTGWRIADAKGCACDEVFRIVHEVTRRPAPNPVARVLEEGGVVGLANHTVLIAADGTERAIDDSAAPILDREGRTIGVVLVFRDVTERRRADLERQAAAREREELLHSERKARADAERADRVKDDFVAMVSHELRTPLSAILGWANVLQVKAGDPEVMRHGLDVIARNARAQAQLVSDLLDVSRIASDKLLLELETVDLDAVIAESIEAVQYAADERGVTIASRQEGAPARTTGDPARLRQVLWNLLTNAVKFTPRGGRIEVLRKSYGTRAEIEVRDTGIGIRPEDLGPLFERFRHSGATTTRPYGGLGLGLAISRHLIELHGGTIRAFSEGQGRGATFTIELPLTPALDERAAAAGAATDTNPLPSLEGITVLVVEDEADMRRMIQMILEDRGARVLTATSAPEALSQLARGADILLSDIRLPDMDGYELIRRIRQREDAHARIPAVALTAFARGEDRARAMRAGFHTHIAKPFEQAELVLTLAGLAEILKDSDSRSRGT